MKKSSPKTWVVLAVVAVIVVAGWVLFAPISYKIPHKDYASAKGTEIYEITNSGDSLVVHLRNGYWRRVMPGHHDVVKVVARVEEAKATWVTLFVAGIKNEATGFFYRISVDGESDWRREFPLPKNHAYKWEIHCNGEEIAILCRDEALFLWWLTYDLATGKLVAKG